MITTVCMNPSFDKTASVDELIPGSLNRLKNVRVDLGGKGIKVAIVLKRLGVAVSCVGCLGESNVSEFSQLIAREHVPFEYYRLSGEIRTNLKLLDEKQKTITELNEPGPSMSKEELEHFLDLLKEKAVSSSYVILSGRLPVGCNDDTYQRCMQVLGGERCILDSAGTSLLYGIKEKPFLVKPNLPEMEAIIKKELSTLRGIRDAALFLKEYGAQNVIVSMGKYGALFTNGQKTLFSPALTVDSRSTVGAGDAMVGGIMMGLDRGLPLEEAFRFGMAAGAASVMTDGTQLLRREDFEALVPKVVVQEV
ncbi:MAG: 1-phosphofructokinase family hexose kinase [Eubacteriales bacterium]|nr:1-phosphofructokinase family hexose kinase [Eubacteriales bacterium]